MIDLSQASFIGPQLSDPRTPAELPPDLRNLLRSANGFVLFGGGLHVRGWCETPEWHSLHRVWTGEDSLARAYPFVRPDDVPFAEDFLGDQFLLRGGKVARLAGELGEVEKLGMGLNEFLDSAQANPDQFLSLNLLRRFQRQGATLEPGQLLSVYPPLCTKEAAAGVSLRAVPASERIRFLADWARQISAVPDGAKVQVTCEDDVKTSR
ncbi:MAG TPA: SMI1/KNR4 family protein [Candidatus Acidoferrales bacterium]|nr:SMI1/KNR4 family protein [Candidatus Acidoferrales bacterium]